LISLPWFKNYPSVESRSATIASTARRYAHRCRRPLNDITKAYFAVGYKARKSNTMGWTLTFGFIRIA
jgi:hypothetical protein